MKQQNFRILLFPVKGIVMNKREQQKEKTLGDILRISEELFHETGFENTTIQQIAHRCGLSKGALYHHFRSKEEVLERICLDYYRQAQTVFLPIVGDSQLNMYEKIKSIMSVARNSRMNSAAAEFRKNSRTETVPGNSNALLERVMENYNEKLYREIFAPILEEGRKEGLCEFQGSSEVLAVFIHALDSSMGRQLNAILADPDDPSSEEAVKGVIKGFTHALACLMEIPYEKIREITCMEFMVNQYISFLKDRRRTKG